MICGDGCDGEDGGGVFGHVVEEVFAVAECASVSSGVGVDFGDLVDGGAVFFQADPAVERDGCADGLFGRDLFIEAVGEEEHKASVAEDVCAAIYGRVSGALEEIALHFQVGEIRRRPCAPLF